MINTIKTLPSNGVTSSNLHKRESMERMLEKVDRSTYRKYQKKDLMRETAYLLNMKG